MGISLSFWRRPEPAEQPVLKAKLVESDWSLKPNPSTYRDRAQESRRVLARISKSSASVIGIAGVRGSGKSSLALKVLGQNSEKGAFTLLIHSPTGYEPHEFLLSIFQRICERVLSLINIRFGEIESLEAQGLQEWRRLRNSLRVLVAAATIISIMAFSYYTVVFQKKLIAQRFSERIALAKHDLATSTTSTARTVIQERLAYYEAEKRSLEQEGYLFFGDFWIGILGAAFYLAIGAAIYYYRQSKRRLELARRFPKETGLRKLATDLLEHLSYQKTLSANTEAGLGFGKSSSKFTRGKTLQARPTSLPGLTSECSKFLELTAEVFGGQAVVCLDELDKIKEPEDLEKLLRGVKGILTSHRTHFLLTISEDALARFSTRQRASRDILESTFEEIVVLDRVNLELAEHIVLTVSDYEPMPQPPKATATPIFWIFGSGIPREIKRGVLLCRDVDLDPLQSRALAIWRVLYNELIDSISSWAALVGGEDRHTYYFLETLEKIRSGTPNESFEIDSASTWFSELLKISFGWQKLIISATNEEVRGLERGKEDAHQRHAAIADSFRRAILEIVLAGSSCLWTLKSDGATASLPKQAESDLLSLFNYFSSNLDFAEAKAMAYIRSLESAGLIRSSGEETE